MKRRAFLAMPALFAAAPVTDARIEGIVPSFQDYLYRAPYRFGGKEVDRVTLFEVRCRLSTRAGNPPKAPPPCRLATCGASLRQMCRMTSHLAR